MTAPHLSFLSTAPQASTKGLRIKPGQLAFLVVSEGTWGGRQWSAGDVVVCEGAASTGCSTVLVPNGRGVPRFGRKTREGLEGTAGEPCSMRRFHPAGEIVMGLRPWQGEWKNVFRPQRAVPAVRLQAPVRSNSPAPVQAKPVKAAKPVAHTATHRQLVLF